MRIAELIEKLSNIKQEYGNCEVVVDKIKADFLTSEVIVKELRQDTYKKVDYLPYISIVSAWNDEPVVEIS